jgi:hypothetical protein
VLFKGLKQNKFPVMSPKRVLVAVLCPQTLQSVSLHHAALQVQTYVYVQEFIPTFTPLQGPLMVAQWLRYCATNRKVAGSIPDGVIKIFH